jgi:Cu/Ag efflux pump CusA
MYQPLAAAVIAAMIAALLAVTLVPIAPPRSCVPRAPQLTKT